MSQAVVILMALLLVSGTLVTVAWGMVYRLTPERKRPEGWRPFISWCVKGLAVPLLIWMLMNLGVSWNLPPFMPEIQVAQAGGRVRGDPALVLPPAHGAAQRGQLPVDRAGPGGPALPDAKGDPA